MKLKFCTPFRTEFPLTIKVNFNPHTGEGAALLNGEQRNVSDFNFQLQDNLMFRLIKNDKNSWDLVKNETSVWGPIE